MGTKEAHGGGGMAVVVVVAIEKRKGGVGCVARLLSGCCSPGDAEAWAQKEQRGAPACARRLSPCRQRRLVKRQRWFNSRHQQQRLILVLLGKEASNARGVQLRLFYDPPPRHTHTPRLFFIFDCFKSRAPAFRICVELVLGVKQVL
jgi:hypothetical protein